MAKILTVLPSFMLPSGFPSVNVKVSKGDVSFSRVNADHLLANV